MTAKNSESEEHVELGSLLQQLRAKLKAWNMKHGHPFEGISDGNRTAIRGELMPSCRAFADRGDLIAALPKGKRFAEVGNFFGEFSVKILERNKPSELHTFDWHLHLMKPEFRSILDDYKTVFFYEGDPSVSATKIPPSTFDIVYLNKATDYAGVRRELDCWLERLMPDGFLVVNNFTAWDPVQGFPYGVLPAVSQFVNEQHLEVVFISLHPRGFLNIALRRM